MTRARFKKVKSAYAELKCALKNSGSNLEKLQESLEKCREVGVIERLLSQVFSIYCDIAHNFLRLNHRNCLL